MTSGVVEKVALFGAPGRLVGILTSPPAAQRRPGPAVVILNAGVIHKVGPNRLNVRLARQLAADGFVSLRFDLSGIGDSPAHPGEVVQDGVQRDIDAAIDYLERTVQPTGFILMGLCTGANTSIRYARRDRRVVGAVLIDPYAYRTRGYYLRHYGSRLLNAESWKHVLGDRRQLWRSLRVAVSGRHPEKAAPETLSAPLQELPKAEMDAALGELTARGADLLHVFTGGNFRYNHAGQFWEAFPQLLGHGGIRVEYLPHAEHTFDKSADQREVIALISGWLQERRVALARQQQLTDPLEDLPLPHGVLAHRGHVA